MKSCNPHIERFMEMVETEEIRSSKEVKALVKHIRHCFDTEDIFTDGEQLENYLGLAKYFPFEQIFPWQEFVIALHDCTYWTDTGLPRWPDLFCLIGRGAGKDGTIAMEAVALASAYNGIWEYDVDICANNEEQAVRPVKDIVAAFERPKNIKKLKRFFYWTTEKVKSMETNAFIVGRTNNPGGKDGMRSGLVVFNEIHQYKDYKNIDVFTTGLGKKKHPRRSYYTTQGDIREGPLDDMLETTENILFGEENDNGMLPFICRLDSKEEVHDPKNWQKANPSLPYLPTLMEETRKEYQEWVKHPDRLSAFMTKRMNIPDGNSSALVCSYDKIKNTNRPLPELEGWECTCGIDYAKVTDLVSVDLHFRKEKMRYDISHSWLCLQSKDLQRLKCPWKEWAREGLLELVDDVEIHPEIVVKYIEEMMMYYTIKMIAIDNYRYTLFSGELKKIGFDPKVAKNLKMIRPSDIMQVVPVIDSCFANDYFVWGNNPLLRWSVNNAKLVPFGRKPGTAGDADLGNYVYGKQEAKSRKTDPFMALVAAMTVEEALPQMQISELPDIGAIVY